jgi:hypothetical protein
MATNLTAYDRQIHSTPGTWTLESSAGLLGRNWWVVRNGQRLDARTFGYSTPYLTRHIAGLEVTGFKTLDIKYKGWDRVPTV